MMAWMVSLYAAYLILVVAMLWLSLRSGRNPAEVASDRDRLRVLGIIGFPLVVGFAGGVGALPDDAMRRKIAAWWDGLR